MENAEIQERVQALRERVDEVDQDLVRALNERASIVQEIVAMKAEAGVPLFDPKREEEILQRAMEYNEGPIYDTSMREIFELILHRIRDLEIQRGEFYR
jgi:3-deoxy-7-phosphoheptulonate synthase/chorismate mutase